VAGVESLETRGKLSGPETYARPIEMYRLLLGFSVGGLLLLFGRVRDTPSFI